MKQSICLRSRTCNFEKFPSKCLSSVNHVTCFPNSQSIPTNHEFLVFFNLFLQYFAHAKCSHVLK